MKKIRIFLSLLGASLFLLAGNAFANTWINYGEVYGSFPSSAVVGSTTAAGYAVSDTQPIGISGAGTVLPAGYNQVEVTDNSTIFSYDTTAYDQAAVVLSTQGYYWNLPSTSFPVVSNTDIILATNNGGSIAKLSSVRGSSFQDGPSSDDFIFSGLDPSQQYYLTFFVQTSTDTSDPTWADISNVNVYENNASSGAATPEPSSLALLGLGLGGILFKRKKIA